MTLISVPLCGPAGARAQREVRDRRDARQRLAAKAERPDRAEIVGARDLARGVALDRQPRVLGLHPLAVVFDADQLLAAELDGDGDAPRAGVERVLDQLLDDGRRTLDDFAGGDLVREIGREDGGICADRLRSSRALRKYTSMTADDRGITPISTQNIVVAAEAEVRQIARSCRTAR